MLHDLSTPRLSVMGDSGFLFEAEGPLCLPTQQRIWKLARILTDDPRVVQVQPGINNLLILTDIEALLDPAFATGITAKWAGIEPGWAEGRLLELEAVYGGEFGIDLDHVATHTGLTVQEVAHLHAGVDYTIFAPSPRPGFGYLSGLDPRLFTPRRNAPENRRIDGNISIGGAQTNLTNPAPKGEERLNMTGWHSIGNVPDLPDPFDFTKDPPALFAMGDRIRYRIARVEA